MKQENENVARLTKELLKDAREPNSKSYCLHVINFMANKNCINTDHLDEQNKARIEEFVTAVQAAYASIKDVFLNGKE